MNDSDYDADRCEEEIWDVRCEKPRGHAALHRARRGVAPIMWGGAVQSLHPGPDRILPATSDPPVG
jgi:hypothetical protein